jgi:hypothetical protein
VTRRTPPPPIDVTALVPELRALRSAAVRLHPRRAAGLPPNIGKMGGAFLDHDPSEWPRCQEHGCAFAPVLQLFHADDPFPFPAGKTVFQLLWCPYAHRTTPKRHQPDTMTLVQVRWLEATPARAVAVLRNGEGIPVRERLAARKALGAIANLTVHEVGADAPYVVNECAIFPERIEELPSVHALSDELVACVEATAELVSIGESLGERADPEASAGYAYGAVLGAAPGSKLGGHVRWARSPIDPRCCGSAMAHLLTIGSVEWQEARWRPVEEQDDTHRRDLGVSIGGDDSLAVFVCRNHEPWKYEWLLNG